MKSMKKIITLIVLSLFLNSCKKNEISSRLNQYLINGELKNLKDSTFITLKSNGINSKKIDSTFSIKNKFTLNPRDNEEGLYSIIFHDSTEFYFDFWYEKKDIEINGDFNKKESLKIKNSPINDFLRKYRKIPQKYDSPFENALKNITDPKKTDEIFQKFVDSIENDQIDLLFTNPNNLFSIKEITRLKTKISKNRLNDFYKKLTNEMKKMPDVKILEEYLSSNQVVIGQKFIDFGAKDINGNKVKLSDFKGKIILLDFWAFWCTICHVQNEKEFSYLNEKYKNDLVIISYSLDEEYEIWEKSTKKDSYKWTNLSNLKGMKDPVSYMYKVNSLPTSFLINQKGIVVKNFIGYKKDSLIEKEIKKLISKKN